MPTYEYSCADCGKTFETIQKITEDPLTECRLCGGKNVKRLISATAFVLKGSGWYKTDYGSGGSSSSSTGSTSSSSSSGDSSPAAANGSSGESKPSSTEKPAAAPAKPSGGSSSE